MPGSAMRFVVAMGAMLGLACSAPPDRDARTISSLETAIPTLMREGHIEGLQIALIGDGELIWEEGFGVADAATGRPVTTETIFEAASLTKPLFAYAVLRMVDRGLIDLDRPLVDSLPREEIEDMLGHPLETEGFRRDWFERITARHILSHSAGTAHGESGAVYPLAFEPGTAWKYSADGYAFLQRVVERVAGAPLDEIIADSVLGPLGMEKSSMVWREEYEATMANGHHLYGEPAAVRRRREATAAASLYTTAGDYARFVCAVISGTGLGPTTAEAMLGTAVDMTDDGGLGWSLGFGTQHDDIGTAFWQWGDYNIFRNYVLADRQTRDGVVYLTNSFNGLSVCSDLILASVGRPALGCIELEYQPHGGAFYELLWDARTDGSEAVAAQLPELVEEHPDLFTVDRIAGMGQILEDREMYAEAAAFHRFNLAQHPSTGTMFSNLAQATLLAGDLVEATRLYRAAGAAETDPMDPTDVAWMMDYIRAMEQPLELDVAFRDRVAGHYGPRHITHRDGRLYYSRDTLEVSAQRPLRAVSRDTFVIDGVTYFRLKVAFDEAGNPLALIGTYQGGRTDESPRDP